MARLTLPALLGLSCGTQIGPQAGALPPARAMLVESPDLPTRVARLPLTPGPDSEDVRWRLKESVNRVSTPHWCGGGHSDIQRYWFGRGSIDGTYATVQIVCKYSDSDEAAGLFERSTPEVVFGTDSPNFSTDSGDPLRRPAYPDGDLFEDLKASRLHVGCSFGSADDAHFKVWTDRP